ncbi:hypothetical protein ACWCRD_43685, partial [Streptomyces sp. NPDC002092]
MTVLTSPDHHVGLAAVEDLESPPRNMLTTWQPLIEAMVRRATVHNRGLRGLALSGQASDRLFHAAIRNFSYSAWTSRGG